MRLWFAATPSKPNTAVWRGLKTDTETAGTPLQKNEGRSSRCLTCRLTVKPPHSEQGHASTRTAGQTSPRGVPGSPLRAQVTGDSRATSVAGTEGAIS